MNEDDLAAARRRAAASARQPPVRPAPGLAVPRPRLPRRRRLGAILRAGVLAAVLVAGPPWLLWMLFGNPLTQTSSWWASHPFAGTGISPSGTGLRVALLWVCWLAWAVVVTLLAGSVAGAVTSRRLPRWRLPMPVHRLVFGLTGTATVALVTPATAAMASAPPAYVATISPGSALPAPANTDITEHRAGESAPAVLVTRDVAYEHRVRKGDTLSKIAKVWLSDADRWPEICDLNKHRHFDTGTLTDCDLIYPGWHLRLPADAAPPPGAKPATPRTPATPAEDPEPPPDNPPPSPDDTASPSPSGPKATQAPPGPTATRPSEPSASAGVQAPGTPPSAPTGAAPEDPADDPPARTGDDLVLPGGTIIPWTLAVALSATAALVWLQRRRRYIPGAGRRDDLTELPLPMRAAQHHTNTTIGPPAGPTDEPPQLPTGGIGLIGPGADDAARGLLITQLTAGTPAEPGQQAEVIIDRHALTTLIGETTVTGWRRLHITDTLEQALTLLDTQLLHRARILDEHNLNDLDTLRNTTPSEEALPPLLLITHAEQATASARARITFGLTHGLDITTIVLGHWPHGPAVTVAEDGTAHPDPESPNPALRLAMFDATTTRDLLDAVREAHTGQTPITAGAPTALSTAVDADIAAQAATLPVHLDASPTATPHDQSAPTRARLRVLGKPRIEGITADGRPLRAKALELAVYLAVHPDGASTRDIGEYLEPDARISQADQRVHTNASNLRHVLGRTGTAGTKNAYVIKAAGRYLLDAATVDVDVWTLRDLMRQATIAAEPHRRELLTTACDLCSAPLAEGQDYEWIQPHRETVRRWGTEAHLLLANDLLDSDPQAASDLLDKAIGLDRYNEALYTKAMHARHALGDADGIRTLLRALTKALADLDAEPHEDTIELAHKLRTSLNHT